MSKYSKLFNKKRIVSLLLGMLAMYTYNVSAAMTCFFASGFATITASAALQAQNITVGSDLPNGTILYSQNFEPSSLPTINCTASLTGYSIFNSLAYTKTPLPLSDWNGSPYAGQIYKTGVSGIGVAATIQGVALPNRFLAASRNANSPVAFVSVYRDVKIIFIKIGPVSAGVIRGSDLPSVKIDFTTEGSDNDAAINIRLTSLSFSGVINIVAQTCQTPDVNVSMGTFDINKTFKGVGTATKWQDASIRFTNCPRFYGVQGSGTYSDNGTVSNTMPLNQISVTLTPNTAIIDGAKGIMGLKTGAGAASGVGIQLAYGQVSDASPTMVNFASPKTYPFANSDSTTKVLPLVARYIQTEDQVKPGRADATATFTINYY
ncbi:fimbrial protein [Serratia sp. (in: enterobacteria)]|uniref:fimbrial protein n=1 Tax=Serratia sp. (in: enterobacteria) TaxID=616 RepID=UPI003988B3D4